MSQQQLQQAEIEAWQMRPVMWNTRGPIAHVVIRATTRFGDVLQSFACGCSTSGFGLRVMTFLAARTRYPRICRRCTERLRAAGARDEISPEA